MGIINVLDKHTSEKIAAGEVVERPSSVIKELVENSIDAGATSVTVEIKNGGVTYIRVTDNGCGMAPDDAKTAFLRHATSKIQTDKDLEKIQTLGFRGEALCSIAAVSRTELFTKQPQGEGTHVVIEGGTEIAAESVGCPDGTTFVVKNLFYNTPARMKFLKSDKTEGSYIMDVCQKQALSHPDVSIRFIRDGKEALFSPGDNTLKNAVHAVFGKDISSNILDVSYVKDGVRVSGVTGKNNLARPNRLMQVFFVNNRFVVNKTLYNALSEAYKNELMIGRFPAAVLNVELDTRSVDVNVSPGKTEVKFENDQAVYEAVYWGVKNALSQAASPRETFESTTKASYKMPFEVIAPQQINFELNKKPASTFKPYPPQTSAFVSKPTPKTINEVREALSPFEGKLPVKEVEGANLSQKISEQFFPKDIAHEKPIESPTTAQIESPASAQIESPASAQIETPQPSATLSFRIVGQLFSTYILVESGDDFILVDQHAAHERIKYEEIKSRGDKTQMQMLLMPITVNLTPAERELAAQNEGFLLDMGFGVEDFGGSSVLLRSLPADCPYEDGGELFIELLSILMGDGGGEITKKRDKAIYTVACKAAVKANNMLTEKELRVLYEKVISLEGISTCPHGRPFSLKFTKYQIEKMFGRIV